MNKTLLDKIIETINIKYPHFSSDDMIDIFCNTKYKDYYLRCQLVTFYDPLYDLPYNEELINVGYYYFFFFVLVNKKYQQTLEKFNYYPDLGIFWGNTIAEVTKEETNSRIYSYEDPNKDPELIIYDSTYKKTILIPLTKEDLEIKENLYLNKSIEEKKDIILLDMDLILANVEKHSIGIKTKLTYPPKIYSFPAFNYSDVWENAINERKDDNEMLYPHSNLDFIKNLYDIICLDLACHYLSRRNFLIILRDVGELAWEWIEKKRVTKKYLKYLNQIQSEMDYRGFPLINFCYKFLDELIEDLFTEKQVLRCHFCGDYIRYHKGKKYCSLKYEGKNCAKRARNKEHYQRHKEEIKPKARKSTREQRAFYKEMDIKK